MRVEIDMGNRLDKSGDTTFGFLNTIQKAMLLKQTVRNQCLDAMIGRTLSKELRLFTACVFILIREHLGRIEKMTIDSDYDGHEGDIKHYLHNFIKRYHDPRYPSSRIEVGHITRKSRAHEVAWRTYRGERKPDKSLTVAQLLKILVLKTK